MKSSTSRMIVTLVVLALVVAWPGLAQSVTVLAKAEIPFSFVVGQKTLPAGEYEIRPGNKVNKDTLWIKKLDSSAAASVITYGRSGKHRQAGPYLLFNRYGNQYFLSQVWTEFDEVGRQTPKTTAERELIQAGESANRRGPGRKWCSSRSSEWPSPVPADVHTIRTPGRYAEMLVSHVGSREGYGGPPLPSRVSEPLTLMKKECPARLWRDSTNSTLPKPLFHGWATLLHGSGHTSSLATLHWSLI